MITKESDDFKYWPYYCEENVWHLCQHPDFTNLEAIVVIISNMAKSCALWHQRAVTTFELPVVWDYHVILLVFDEYWQVWDADSTLPLGTKITEYLSSTFPGEVCSNEKFVARFRLFKSMDFVKLFSSDRSHMLDMDGSWMSEPPPWSPIVNDKGVILENLIDMSSERLADTLSLVQMQQMFSAEATANGDSHNVIDSMVTRYCFSDFR